MFNRNRLSAAIVTVLASAAGTNQVFAQDDAQAVEEVIVTGIRASAEAAMDIKRDAVGVVDAISAEDIGKMPDSNLAESLQRIAGVSISRTNGEGAQVTVRGIDPSMNMVTLNGRVMPTVTNNNTQGDKSSRAFDFANLASETVSGVEVYKTGKANVGGGGLGATINLKTVRPLDLGDTKASFGVKAVHDTTVTRSDVGRKVTPEVSGLYSWVNEDENFGVTVTAAYQERDNTRSRAYVQNWQMRQYGFTDGAANKPDEALVPVGITTADITNLGATDFLYALPTNLALSIEDSHRERTNGQVTFQYRPIESVTTTFDFTFSEYNTSADRSQAATWYNESDITRMVFDQGQEVATPAIYEETYAVARGKDLSFTNQLFESVSNSESLGLNVVWDVNEMISLEADYHQSRAANRTDRIEIGLNANIITTEYAEFGLGLPVLGATIDDSRADKGNNNGIVDGGDVSSAMGGAAFDTQLSTVKELRLMGKVDLGDLGFFTNAKVEFGVTDRSDSNAGTNNDGTAPRITMGNWGGVDPDVFGPDWASYFVPRDFGRAFPSFSDSTDNPKFLEYGLEPSSTAKVIETIEAAYAMAQSRIKITTETPAVDDPATPEDESLDPPTVSYIWVTELAADGNHAKYQDTQLTPDNFNNFRNGKIQPNNVLNLDRTIEEDVTAFYATFQAGFDLAGMEANIGVGIRQESTDLTSINVQNVPLAQHWEDDNDWSFVYGAGGASPYTVTNSYDNFLPNIDLDVSITDSLKVRASYSQTMARPSFGNLSSQVGIGQRDRTASAGNPLLDPLSSTNLDLSVEWFYGDSSYVSVAYFRKDVKDFIGTVVLDEKKNFFGLYDIRSGAFWEEALADIQTARDNGEISPITDKVWDPASEADQHTMLLIKTDKDPGDETTYVDSEAVDGSGNRLFPDLEQFTTTQPVNQEDDSIDGLEFSIQHWFGETGFGVQANYTLVDSGLTMDNKSVDRQFALLGLSDSANLIGFYERDGIQARIAYNWRDTYLASTAQGGSNAPGYVKDYAQLDFSLGYELSDSVNILFEGINVTGEDSRLYGRSERQMYNMEDLGARYQVGIRYTY